MKAVTKASRINVVTQVIQYIHIGMTVVMAGKNVGMLLNDKRETGREGIWPHSPGVQVVSYWITATKRNRYSIVCNPMFTLGICYLLI